MRFAPALSVLVALAGSAAAAESDGPAGKGTTGTAGTTRKDVPWKKLAISATPTGRYLRRAESGKPFLWQADTAWELIHRLNTTEIEEYFGDRAAKGFNVVLAAVISEYNGTTFPTYDGEVPLIDGDPMRPNDKYFTWVDHVVERAAAYGILVAMAPTWGQWVTGGDQVAQPIFDEANAEAYGKYIGSRYPGLPKVLGGDVNAFWVRKTSDAFTAFKADPSQDAAKLLGPVEDTRPVWASMVRAFEETEPQAGFTPFLTWHAHPGWYKGTPEAYGHNYLNGSFGRLSMDAVHSGHRIWRDDKQALSMKGRWDSNKNYANILAMRASFTGPVVDLGSQYENSRPGADFDMVWNASHVRHRQYNALLSGAAGFTYATGAVAQMFTPRENLTKPELYIAPASGLTPNQSWRDALQYPGSAYSASTSLLFSGMHDEEWDTMEPERAYVLSPQKDRYNVMEFEDNRYIAALVSSSHYWVYTGYGDAFDVDLDGIAVRFAKPRLAKPRPEASVSWYDPRKGLYVPVADMTGHFELTGHKTFQPPTNGTVNDDWVLVLTEQ